MCSQAESGGQSVLRRGMVPWRGRELARAFKGLNEAKFTAETSNFLKSHKIVQQPRQAYTFTPKINKKSRQIAEQYTERYMSEVHSRNEENIDDDSVDEAKSGISAGKSGSAEAGRSQFSAIQSEISTRINMMYDKLRQRNDRIKEAQIRSRLRELSGCTFKPECQSHYTPDKSSSYVRQDLAKRRKQKDAYKTKEERDFQECTFHPQINYGGSNSSR